MSAGQWIQQVTLGWLLYDLTGSSVLLGALNGLRALSFLIASPIAGVVADRTERKKILTATQYVLMTTTVAMGFLVALKLAAVWHLFAFTLITAIAWAFTDPVRQSMVPTLVPKEELINAVALNSAAFNMTKVIGPSVGGLLFVAFGAAGNFFVQGAAYAAVLLSIYWMVIPPAPTEAKRSSALANLKEGLLYIWSNPTVFALLTAAHLCHAVSNPHAGFSKGRSQGGTRRLGDHARGAGAGSDVGGIAVGELGSSRSTPGRADAFQPDRSRHRHEYVFLDDVFPTGNFSAGEHRRFLDLLHGHHQHHAPGHRAGSFARQGHEHLRSRPRLDANWRSDRRSQRPLDRRAGDRQLHGFCGDRDGWFGCLARAGGAPARVSLNG